MVRYFSQDVDNSLEKRLSVRPQHLARLQQLQNEGRLLTAGPMPAIDSENPVKQDLLARPSSLNLLHCKKHNLGQMLIRTSKLAFMLKS